MTFKSLLNYYSAQCEKLNKELTAVKLLILHYFQIDNTQLYLKYNDTISEDDVDKFDQLAKKYLIGNVPVQYLMGYTYFYNLKIMVNKHVLIPRFETEILVSEILKRASSEDELNILDIGSGSGCIAIALKTYLLNASVIGVDISQEALAVAIENAKLNNVEVEFFKSDIFANIASTKKYDIIVSNPPYIPIDGEVDNLVLENEPHLALFASEDGLYYYLKIIAESKQYLKENSMLAFEIGYNQRESVIQIIEKYFPNSKYELIQDFQNYDRIIIIYPNVR